MYNFATAAPITTVLRIPAGRVRFIATDRTDTAVEIAPANAAKSRDVKAAEHTTADYADGVLRIETATKNRYLGSTGSITVTVGLPAGSHVEAVAESAELRTVGRLGDVSFEGAYRRIELDEAASLRLTATDGDVEVARVTGPARITTTRGDISVAEALSGEVVLRTQAGDITVAAAAGVSATLDAGTSHGRISNALKNGGGGVLDIHATTSIGDITARSR
ncbi:DUF4097 family beta strand repeat-containing protein [Phytomonospora endophytica]|uniref:DUF4097 and DUF4098 domain-containing protein YvlB n=1 Tax=Phytomonospora endophytica TaxID=714109 RepID=A0A841FRE9_9ACTN|nr:DUF4097 family beta strand repeat-containing protein [Phytomonospora endophytica]MBB6035867.1 DUF4097 and DUF4098 domain-containing protein YvlB [Phytomonospora endophytica]GIG71138.1 hypothetical protein Pen01_74330 [Phytomonospora endophytica]